MLDDLVTSHPADLVFAPTLAHWDGRSGCRSTLHYWPSRPRGRMPLRYDGRCDLPLGRAMIAPCAHGSLRGSLWPRLPWTRKPLLCLRNHRPGLRRLEVYQLQARRNPTAPDKRATERTQTQMCVAQSVKRRTCDSIAWVLGRGRWVDSWESQWDATVGLYHHSFAWPLTTPGLARMP